MSNPRESNVEVSVLDLSGLIEKATEHLRVKDRTISEATINYEWGIVETPDGLYALCNEGVGSIKPITAENPLVLHIGAKYLPDEEGRQSFTSFPLTNVSYTDEDLKEFPIARKENLATFIRKFGSRLEANFEEWDKALSKDMEIENAC